MNYGEWLAILNGERLPAAIVDLDAFDRNIHQVRKYFQGKPHKLRLATKSVRVPGLISRALASGAPFRGLMCFSAEEALALSSLGLDDFLVAYPTVQLSDLHALKKLHQTGKTVSLIVDCEEHLRALDQELKGSPRPFPVVIDVDMSLRLLGGLVHLGVRRSPIRSVPDVLNLVAAIQSFPTLSFHGLMGYEAQVAGLGDKNPFNKFLNPIAHWVRMASVKQIKSRRHNISAALEANNHKLQLFNGGGTGSLSYTLEETHLTEVTIGSALYSPGLFDYFSNIRFEPSCFFALQAVRSSDSGTVTLQGGGYIASGEPGWDKVPAPWLPDGLKLLGSEACGEVQTPVQILSKIQIQLGNPVFFRHAKAGELAERFNEVLLVSGGKIVGREKTYRGLGHCFF